MGVLSDLEPKEVFEQFEALSMVPRRTYRCEIIGDYDLNKVGKYKLLYRATDSFNNVTEKALKIQCYLILKYLFRRA